ncbi:MAG: caspase family protein [Myxococcota bacterium]
MAGLVALGVASALATPVGREIGLGDYRAVLFAAQDYAEASGIPDLATPNHDIARIGAVLEEQYGFTVELHPDATRATIDATLAALADEVDGDDVVLVYYAGHGEYDRAQGVGYWLPSDAVLDDPSTWLGNPTVQTKLRGLGTRHVLLVIDACFSGEFARERGIDRIVQGDRYPGQKLARRLAAEPSRLYLSSGGNETVSDDPPPGRADDGRPPVSVFAYFLEKLLLQADQRYVLPSDLVPPLRQRVFENARQIPRLGVVASTGHEGGEVPLVNLKARACVEGTDSCLGPTITLDDVPTSWQYDAGTRAFANPLQLRRQRRVVSGSLFVAFAAAAGLSAVAANQRRSDWVGAFEACAAEPVVDENCNTVTNRDLAQRDVTLLSGLSIGMGALAVGSGVTFAMPGRAARQYRRTR